MIKLAARSVSALSYPAQIRRKEEGSYDTAGNWTDGTSVLLSIKALVQPLSLNNGRGGSVLEDLPAGIRECATHTVWSRSTIKLDDVVITAGRSYRVLYVQERSEGFSRAVMEWLRDA